MNPTHHLHESRSLRMHRLVAERYRCDPETVTAFALGNLSRWRRHGVECGDFEVWQRLLQGPPQALLEALTGTGEESIRLRQSSPFAGFLPEPVRREILASAE